MGSYTEHRFKKMKSILLNPIHLPSIALSAFIYILSSNGSLSFSLQGRKWDCALLCCPLHLESLFLHVCVSLILVAGELSLRWNPFFFHLIQVHSKKLAGFSFLEDDWCVDLRKSDWNSIEGQLFFNTTLCTHMGGRLPVVRSLSFSGFLPDNPLKFLERGSLHILLPLWFISLSMNTVSLRLPSPLGERKKTMSWENLGDLIYYLPFSPLTMIPDLGLH